MNKAEKMRLAIAEARVAELEYLMRAIRTAVDNSKTIPNFELWYVVQNLADGALGVK